VTARAAAATVGSRLGFRMVSVKCAGGTTGFSKLGGGSDPCVTSGIRRPVSPGPLTPKVKRGAGLSWLLVMVQLPAVALGEASRVSEGPNNVSTTARLLDRWLASLAAIPSSVIYVAAFPSIVVFTRIVS
jgi:hypothetical protein